MGYAECNINMESRVGFCPRSSSKLTQSIVKDHMLSHYKKVYSAKAAIDASVPKSLIHNVKYNDQIRQERKGKLRKGARPQSARSVSQRDSRASCSSAQSRLSMQYDDSPYLGSRSSTVSSPGFGTSFHAKKVGYSSCRVSSQDLFDEVRPASEIKYRSPRGTLYGKQSVCSLAVSGDQSSYKTFRDPVQKTYSGDLLQKHPQHFTQDKPFTPKTLKSDRSSYLSNYRYYRAPRRKPTQDCTQSRAMGPEANHGSTKTKKYKQEMYKPSQGLNTEHGWSEDELSSTYFPAAKHLSQANKSRDCDFFESSSRVSPEDRKFPIMKNVSAEEEELIYLEFVSAVTEDILSRGHISDRVLDRVIQRHINMNRHQLDESKMRHLLEVLRKDFEEPTTISTCSTDPGKNVSGQLDAFLPLLESGGAQVKTKENNDLFRYASLINYCDSPDYPDPLLASTPLCSPEKPASPAKTNEEQDDDHLEKGINSTWLTEHVSCNPGISEEDFHQNQTGVIATNTFGDEKNEYAYITSDKGLHEDQAVGWYDGQSKELTDLGRDFSESLHVSSNTRYTNVETSEQHTNTAASVTDNEF